MLKITKRDTKCRFLNWSHTSPIRTPEMCLLVTEERGENSARHIKRPIRLSNRGEVSAHAGDKQKTPVSPARSPRGLCSCLHASAVICCLLFGWMSRSGAHGARFWHNDWLQSCGSLLRNPTVATISPRQLNITQARPMYEWNQRRTGVAVFFYSDSITVTQSLSCHDWQRPRWTPGSSTYLSSGVLLTSTSWNNN